MIKCVKCNELIGDNISECPFCKTQISEEDRKKALMENELIQQAAVGNAINENIKRVKAGAIISVLMLLFAISGMLVIAEYNLDFIWGVVLFVIVCLIYAVSVKKLRIGLCPYCESFMGRGMLFRAHCPRCGGRLM